MPEPPYRPLDSQVIPRFADVRTFMRLPAVEDLKGVIWELLALRAVAP